MWIGKNKKEKLIRFALSRGFENNSVLQLLIKFSGRIDY